jgi:hypothetical protein
MSAESGGAQEMGGQTTTSLTIGGTFTTGLDASLNMSGLDDEMGGDSTVEIYATSGAEPTRKQSGSTNRRGNYSPAPANFSTTLDGGSWTAGGTYWVQVQDTNGTTTTTWEGSCTATAGTTQDITLTTRTF